ncbi:MAG: cryptochrome/photolyase family protein [Planctomycetota bacterium]
MPNQLFETHPGFQREIQRVVLLEDSLFIGDHHHPANFCKQKLWLHRASMKQYEKRCREQGREVVYLDYLPGAKSLLRQLEKAVKGIPKRHQQWVMCDPVDFLFEKRIHRVADAMGTTVEFLPSSQFLNSREQNRDYRKGKKRWFMADYYKVQRKRHDLLIDDDGEPTGGQWSFDADNRKKVPRGMLSKLPAAPTVDHDEVDVAAAEHIEHRYPQHPGRLESLYYPTTHQSARNWLTGFLSLRLEHFGTYEDAIVEGESWLWHSVLSSSLNIGLLTPDEIVQEIKRHLKTNPIAPLNSVEGFVRQVIGWREFMRATYEDLGVAMRTTNHWNHRRRMPVCFYDASTGIAPVDDAIRRLLDTGYCHHIERLMVLGGFMFLCEIDPDEIYRWFMELFVDSYDWVMVPNAYAMSQNADGGLITTKPYFSGSAYIKKMSNHRKGDWCDVWDGLYWRWIHLHADALSKNPRWAMMCATAKRMDASKMQTHLDNAQAFLSGLK